MLKEYLIEYNKWDKGNPIVPFITYLRIKMELSLDKKDFVKYDYYQNILTEEINS